MPLSSVLGAQSLVRPGVCTSSTRPASPFEGQLIFETDTNRVVAYDGSNWVYVADTDTPPASQLVKTQTIGTAVSTVTVSDAFNSEFDNYRITITGIQASVSSDILFTLVNSSGTEITTDYQTGGFYQSGTATLSGNFQTAGNNAPFGHLVANTKISLILDVLAPNLAENTMLHGSNFGANVYLSYGTRHAISTAYPSFRLKAASGTLTGGIIRVYGYRNS